MKWFTLIFGILSNATASILIKKAGEVLSLGGILKNPLNLLFNLNLVLGILFYVMALLFYIMALKEFPLHIAHPILTSGSIALVSVCAFLFFNEPLSFCKIVGILFILTGVVFLTIK